MADIFRKSALDKISSPEQLDRSIRMISPSFWIAAVGGLLIISVALVWSIFGRIPVNVSANGMYMGNDGIYNAVAEANGVVEEVFVSEGQDVAKGEKLVQLDDSLYAEEISELEERRDAVEEVTFWSEGDVSNADTKPLIDIKSQADLSGSTLTSDQAALRERRRQLSKQKKAVSSAKSRRDSAKRKYDKLSSRYNSYHYDDRMKAATARYEAASQARSAYQASHPAPSPEEAAELERLKEAEADALKAKQDLETDYMDLQTGLKNAESAYSMAEQTYKSEVSAKKSLEDSISQLEARVSADSSNESSQVSSLEKQFNAAKGGVLDQLDQEIRKQRREAAAMLFTARMNGRVTSVSVSQGDAVQSGMTLFRLVSANEGEEDIVCYVPVGEGRKIKKGMKAAVYPSTANRQEYGHMYGTVEAVSDYTATAEDLLNELGDKSLVQAFQQAGPVVRVSMKLERDKETASGFRWSSKKGGELTLDEGTVVSADIIADEKAPITMLIPYLKEKLTVKHGSEQPAQDTQQTQDSQNTTGQ